jgi:hypothetical protein
VSRATANSAGAPEPGHYEKCGGVRHRNYWYHIGVTREVAAALKRHARRYGFKTSPSASMARQLIYMALLSLPEVEKNWNAVLDYCDAEGIINTEGFVDNRIASAIRPKVK